jgi:hypothetical protein
MSKTTETDRLGHRAAVPDMDRAVQSTRNTDILADYHSRRSEALRRAQLRKDVECDTLFIRNANEQNMVWLVMPCDRMPSTRSAAAPDSSRYSDWATG